MDRAEDSVGSDWGKGVGDLNMDRAEDSSSGRSFPRRPFRDALCDWDTASLRERSAFVLDAIRQHDADLLRHILDKGWDVHKVLHRDIAGMFGFSTPWMKLEKSCAMTALLMAVQEGWTEGLRLLLTAGSDLPPRVWEQHYVYKGRMMTTRKDPLFYCLNHLQVLILRTAQKVQPDCINAAIHKAIAENADLFDALIGANILIGVKGNIPVTYRMVTYTIERGFPQWNFPTVLYLGQHLDVLYQHGADIYSRSYAARTALEYAVSERGHSNSVRWLLRHGADIPPSTFTQLWEYFRMYQMRRQPQQQYEGTPSLLLKAGMRLPAGAHGCLVSMKSTVSTWLHLGKVGTIFIQSTLRNVWDRWLRDVNQGVPSRCSKVVFPEDLSSQTADLQSFSDESLPLYPDSIPRKWHFKDEVKFALHQIQRVLEFLSQPQSLQWHCRRCVRENLVSLQPSVVKILPVPAILKRYILCHEL